ncbi:MAG: site-2 protease family protein [Natronomonas sp.]
MNTLLWILFGLLLYTSIAMALDARGKLPSSFQVSGPLLTIHTKRGRALLDWLATPRRFWRAWGNFGVGIALVIMVGSFFSVLFSVYGTLSQPELALGIRPQDALVIPGVNQFLPLEAAVPIVFGLVVGLVVHEGGHGLLCRVEDIDIDSMGIALLAIVPLGAFVKPNEESQDEADRGGKTRMFAAGVTNNFLVTVVAFIALFAIVGTLVSVVPGVAVGGALPGSAAADAGVERGDVLTSVDGNPVENADEFAAALEDADRTVTVDRHESAPVTVERKLLVSRTVVDSPVESGTEITAVEGTPVHTRSDFEAAVADRERVTLETDDGTVEIPIGAFSSTVMADRPMAEAGVPDRPILVHSVGDEPTPTLAALIDVLETTEPGEPIDIVVFVGEGDDPWNGDRRTFEVTPTAHPDRDGAQLGIAGLREGTSGIYLDDFGVDPYPATEYHGILGGADIGSDPITTFVRRIGAVLLLPFANLVDPALAYNFAGFTDDVASFYEVSGPLGAGAVFVLANLLFWTGWINLNLGVFNCIPSYPLDGGHILRSSVEATLARLPIDATPWLASVITVGISIIMIASVLGLLFIPRFV